MNPKASSLANRSSVIREPTASPASFASVNKRYQPEGNHSC
jgi:hypothetical protein